VSKCKVKVAEPSDLPVEQETKIGLVINLKTGEALAHHPAHAARPRRWADRV